MFALIFYRYLRNNGRLERLNCPCSVMDSRLD